MNALRRFLQGWDLGIKWQMTLQGKSNMSLCINDWLMIGHCQHWSDSLGLQQTRKTLEVEEKDELTALGQQMSHTSGVLMAGDQCFVLPNSSA